MAVTFKTEALIPKDKCCGPGAVRAGARWRGVSAVRSAPGMPQVGVGLGAEHPIKSPCPGRTDSSQTKERSWCRRAYGVNPIHLVCRTACEHRID